MRMKWGVALGLMSLALVGPALAEERVANSVADSWLGHDASDLLVQWPIDSGFSTFELSDTNETGYQFIFGRRGYSYNTQTTEAVGAVGSQIIMGTREQHIDVPTRIDCTIVFYANAEGVISRYKYDGGNCTRYMIWARPKKK